jgi:c-di-GMP-binding flagellar brake protein YcgR
MFASFPILEAAMSARRYPRTQVDMEVWLGQHGMFTRTPRLLRDLSEEGAFVETDERFALGSIVNVCFTIPATGRLIATTAAVRHQRVGRGVGLEFLDISPEDRRELRSFVEEQE